MFRVFHAISGPVLRVIGLTLAVMMLGGCASSSHYSTHYTPGISFAGYGSALTTGSLTTQRTTRNQVAQTAQTRRVEAPRMVQKPKQAWTGAQNKPRARANQKQMAKRDLASDGRHENFGPMTYDPLPYYATPDKNRNRYTWNGSHERQSIDNRQKHKRSHSKVFVDGNGRRSVVVAPGDTMFGIASANGLTTGQLMAFNEMTSSSVRAGQILFLPDAAQRSARATPQRFR